MIWYVFQQVPEGGCFQVDNGFGFFRVRDLGSFGFSRNQFLVFLGSCLVFSGSGFTVFLDLDFFVFLGLDLDFLDLDIDVLADVKMYFIHCF